MIRTFKGRPSQTLAGGHPKKWWATKEPNDWRGPLAKDFLSFPSVNGPKDHTGDYPKNWRAVIPKTGGHQPYNWSGALSSENDKNL